MAHKLLRFFITASFLIFTLTGLFFTERGGVKPTYAATIVVNSLADTEDLFDGVCTLREAINGQMKTKPDHVKIMAWRNGNFNSTTKKSNSFGRRSNEPVMSTN